MVDCVTYNAFKLSSNVDSCFALLCNFLLPFAASITQMLLVHLAHHCEFVLEEHWSTGFPFDAPLMSCFHHRPSVAEDGTKHILHQDVLVDELVFCCVDVLYHLRVRNVNTDFIQEA